MVHNYGIAAEIEAIQKFLRKEKIFLIEDCAEAWFSKCKNRYLGQFSDIATFSMHATKTISSGEGGMVLFKSKLLYERAKLIRSHGLDREKSYYYHFLPGNNYRLSNLLAAVAFAQLENKDKIIESQKRASEIYITNLKDSEFWTLQQGVSASGNLPWAIAVRIKADKLKVSRDELLKKLDKNGVEARPGFYSAFCLPYVSKIQKQSYPVSNTIFCDILVLPCPLGLSIREVEKICKTFKKIIKQNSK